MGPPSDSPASTGPPDRQTLRLLERHLASDPLVETTTFDPTPHEPRLLHAHLDTARYPASTTTARLDVRWFTTGDFSFHYLEANSDTTHWECRWDRHPNTHNTRIHFHHPPDSNDITDLSLPSQHPLDVYSTVLDAIEQRLTDHWE
ncbi:MULTISPECIES: hypothetical protein [unclassified Halobacterium]|jgi:hypothetical protein|uniref:hypothetical protein n=1 Tax=unclassified Halobacterium TaxID=2668073 RepID=UPI001E2C4FC8|nr:MULTISPECIES: hypothetical protein [unclassified Halobacterium]MCD2200746.1 hypothetical protein [Halobacterium sp. KA-4]MCD2204922.1 hypothetical protein [Halobacterium sp. KA-6]